MERYNLVVIGAGSGGLVVAAGGSGLGARVALAEKHALPFTPEGGTPFGRWGATACSTAACPPRRSCAPRRPRMPCGRRGVSRFAASPTPARRISAPSWSTSAARRPTSPQTTPSNASGPRRGRAARRGAPQVRPRSRGERHDGLGAARRHRDGLAREHPADPRPRGGGLPHERSVFWPPEPARQPAHHGRRADRDGARAGLRPPRVEGHDRVLHSAHLPEGGRRRRGRPRQGAEERGRHDPRRRSATKVARGTAGRS